MFKKIFAVAFLVAALLTAGCIGDPNNPVTNPDYKEYSGQNKKLLIYTSMKENLIGGIIEGFKKKYPDVEVDYNSGGAGKIMAKLYAERQSGQTLADIIWTSEVPDFYQMKKDGMLEIYKPNGFDEIINPFDDYDGSFTAARLGTLGIVVNSDKVDGNPEWETLATDPLFKDSFGIADPALSGTSYMSVALLEKQFGWDYFNRLHENGTKKGKGSSQVIDEVAEGTLNACLGVDYITIGKIAKGAHLRIVYPKELLMVPSPVAILKDSSNKEVAKNFIDYLLTAEAQQKVAEAGTVPVRPDVKIPEKYNLPSPTTAFESGIKINYTDILSRKESTVKKFSELFR